MFKYCCTARDPAALPAACTPPNYVILTDGCIVTLLHMQTRLAYCQTHGSEPIKRPPASSRKQRRQPGSDSDSDSGAGTDISAGLGDGSDVGNGHEDEWAVYSCR